jgi:crossover junction endodeoxyribonuclease RuvC
MKRAKTPSVPCRAFTGLILGLDPSVRGTGLAVLRYDNSPRPVLVFSQTVKVAPKYHFTAALGFIHLAVQAVLERYPIAAVATEETIFVQNIRTAQLMGAARGAALGPISALAHIQIAQLPPTAIKLAVTGDGKASKERIQQMVKLILGLPEHLPEDESDAAGAALAAVGRRMVGLPGAT